MRFFCFLLAAGVLNGATLLTPEQKNKSLDSFEYVWTTIRDKHWDKSLDGAEWLQAHDEFRPKMERAESMESARKVLNEMIGRLHMTHFGVIPGDVYSDLEHSGAALDTRLIEGQAVLVTGKHAGWEVLGSQNTIARVGKVYEHSTMRELMISRAVSAAAGRQPVQLADGHGRTGIADAEEFEPRGEATAFGNLPTQHVWVESKKMGNAGYFAFNLFLDPGRLIPALGSAIEACQSCEGFVIDLRGNPGGIGAMAMGMAGFFVSKPGEVLGTMQLRDSSLKFAINPRPPHFGGKLAVLVDGLSASTSEIFAEGMQDLKRARVFGSRTAGAALPSVIERLPNGDAFQYAIANYVSQGGTVLEGRGVTPDVEVRPKRESLLKGKDDVLDAALEWMGK
ncbi:MAG: S41 family peptidase [Acidobacteriota bacterium]|nr:S41 family peptidase [Acidobacteriota bacterium]